MLCGFYLRCNKYGEYPIGHPQIITENFAPLSKYFGLVKCFVLPPRSLYHPVLPYRTQGKLIFPLCRTCVPIPCSKNPIVTTTPNELSMERGSPWNFKRLWKRVTSCSKSTRCGTSLSTLMASSKTTLIRF